MSVDNALEHVDKEEVRYDVIEFGAFHEQTNDRRAVAAAIAPRTNNPCGRAGSTSHSAHIGSDAEVHYRWHPLHGRRVRLEGSEHRSIGRFVHVEGGPGVITVLAAWMLDPVVCARMETACVSVTALIEMHQLLIERDC